MNKRLLAMSSRHPYDAGYLIICTRVYGEVWEYRGRQLTKMVTEFRKLPEQSAKIAKCDGVIFLVIDGSPIRILKRECPLSKSTNAGWSVERGRHLHFDEDRATVSEYQQQRWLLDGLEALILAPDWEVDPEMLDLKHGLKEKHMYKWDVKGNIRWKMQDLLDGMEQTCSS